MGDSDDKKSWKALLITNSVALLFGIVTASIEPVQERIRDLSAAVWPPTCRVHGRVTKGTAPVKEATVKLCRLSPDDHSKAEDIDSTPVLLSGEFEFYLSHGRYRLIIRTKQGPLPYKHEFLVKKGQKKDQEITGLDLAHMCKGKPVTSKDLDYFAAIQAGDVKRLRELYYTGKADLNKRDGRNLTGLMIAADAGNAEVVEALLALGAHHFEADPMTALHWACRKGHVKAADVLLRRGASPNVGNEWGGPLQTAAEQGYTELVRKLLAFGANPNIRNKNGITPLMDATVSAVPEIASLLVCYGADVNAAEYGKYHKRTALMWAAEKGQLEIVRILLFAKPDLQKKTTDGKTAMDLAKEAGQLRIVNLLNSYKQ